MDIKKAQKLFAAVSGVNSFAGVESNGGKTDFVWIYENQSAREMFAGEYLEKISEASRCLGYDEQTETLSTEVDFKWGKYYIFVVSTEIPIDTYFDIFDD